VCWFRIHAMTVEMDNEDISMGISPERESPPPSVPPASKSPTIRSAQPVTRADQIRQQQAQYQRKHQHQQRSPPTPLPPPSPGSPQSSEAASPPHQLEATISEIREDQLDTLMPSMEAVAEEMSDLQLLDKSSKRLQESFWRPIPDTLTNKMHGILEGLRVVMENQEGVYYHQ
jgi:hypothetical protein